MITLVFVLLVAVLVAVFSVQNAAPVSVNFLFWHFEASLALVMLLSVLAGIVIGMIVLSSIRFARAPAGKGKQDTGETSERTP